MNIHHEETVINEVLNYRKSFTDKWKPYSKKELTKIINILRENMNNDNKNTDKKLHISDVMNSILNDLNEKSIEYIKKYECSLYSVGEIDSMTLVYEEQSNAVEECIKIVKKYYL